MTEIRLAIVFSFVATFWAWAFAIYGIVLGDWVMGGVLISALIPVTLLFCIRAREAWNS